MSYHARYDLNDREIAAACRAISNVGRRERFRCIGTGPTTELAQVARTVECRVFDEEYGNDAHEMTREYAPYEEGSYFFVVLDVRRRRPAGVMRIVAALHSEGRLKSVDDLVMAAGLPVSRYLTALDEVDLTSTLDIATLAILPSYRGSTSGTYQVGKLLYRAMNRHATDGAWRHIVMIVDRRARRSLEKIGAPLIDVLDCPFNYLGSPESYAVRMIVQEMSPSGELRSKELLGRVRSRLLGKRSPRGLIRDVALARYVRDLACGGQVDRHIQM